MKETEAAPFVRSLLQPALLTDPRRIEAPSFLHEERAWEQATEFARRLHAAAPFAAAVEKADWHGELPGRARDRIESEASRGRMALALLDEELNHALGAFERAGVDVLLLKGADLGRRFYPRRELRPMSDTDLLLRPEQYERGTALLRSLGYEAVGIGYRGRFRGEFARKGAPVVELHERLVEGDDPEAIRGYWDRAEQVPAFGPGVKALCPTDLLSHLVRHGAVQHAVESPIWLLDLHFLIQARSVDWVAFTGDAETRRYRAGAWFLLDWIRRQWGTPVPASALEGLRPGTWRRSALHYLGEPRRLFPYGRRKLAWLGAARWLLRDGAGDALRYVGARQIRSIETWWSARGRA